MAWNFHTESELAGKAVKEAAVEAVALAAVADVAVAIHAVAVEGQSRHWQSKHWHSTAIAEEILETFGVGSCEVNRFNYQ